MNWTVDTAIKVIKASIALIAVIMVLAILATTVTVGALNQLFPKPQSIEVVKASFIAAVVIGALATALLATLTVVDLRSGKKWEFPQGLEHDVEELMFGIILFPLAAILASPLWYVACRT